MSQVESVASYSLTTMGENSPSLRNALIRIALSSNSPASKAVLYSLLAVSAIHRYGPHRQAVQHKVSALQCLTESTNRGLGTKEAVQHTAAGMLLCTFEVGLHLSWLYLLALMTSSRYKILPRRLHIGYGMFVEAKALFFKPAMIEWLGKKATFS